MADYNLLGPKWKHDITWSFATASYPGQPGVPFTAQFTSEVEKQDIREAFAKWASAANLNFTEVADAEEVDIRFGFAPIDGPGNTAGIASSSFTVEDQPEYLASTVRFDPDENWTDDANGGYTSNGHIPMYGIALHEIGHSLGLAHYDVEPAIMNAVSDGSVTDLTIHDINGIVAIYGPPTGGPATLAKANDFNGDGKGDILFSASNSDYLWAMNDRAIASQGGVDSFDSAFSMQVTGDFDGDGKADVLFQNPTTGGVYQWQLNGTAIKAQGAVDVGDAAFHILGTADFNGDDKSDVLFRNDAGFIYMWQMNGLTNTAQPVSALAPTWHVQGAGDFDGDGKADLLLKSIGGNASESGAYYLWKMDGNQIIGQGGIERPGADWETVGVGDFDGDGKSDFAVRHASNFGPGEAHGAVWVYLMDGTTIKSQDAAGLADSASWHVQQISDLNGDGKDDILFRNDAGYFYSWNMNGTSIASEGLLGTQAGNWASPSLHTVSQHWDLV